MPPSGNLYGMKVLVANAPAEDEGIAFNAGTHTKPSKLNCKKFTRRVKTEVATFKT